MSRFIYLKGESFFHRMDPTWKLLWNFAVLAAVLVNFDLLYSAGWFLYILLMVLVVARIRLKRYFAGVSIFLSIAALIFIWSVLYYPEGTHVLFVFGPIRVTTEGIVSGVGLVFRVLVIVSLSQLFLLTTEPSRLVESLIQVAKIPYRIGYTAHAALRFMPLYEREAQQLLQAHQVRGVGELGNGVLARIRLYWSLLVPLLVNGLRRAQISSIAMESRGFGAYPQRTVLHDAEVSTGTRLFVLAHVPLAAAAFYYFIVLGHGAFFSG